MKFKLRGFKIGYRIKILHEISNKEIKHKIIYELIEGDNVKITEDPIEYKNFVEKKISKEIAVRIRILASQLRSKGYILIPSPNGTCYYIVKVKTNKKGKVEDFEIIEKLPDLRLQKSNFFKLKEKDKLIVGYIEEMFISDVVAGEPLLDNEIENAKEEIKEILKNIKVNIK